MQVVQIKTNMKFDTIIMDNGDFYDDKVDSKVTKETSYYRVAAFYVLSRFIKRN